MTAWSSSRESRVSRPSVTAMLAVGITTGGKRVRVESGTTHILRPGSPDAMAISSTTLTSCFSPVRLDQSQARGQSTFSAP